MKGSLRIIFVLFLFFYTGQLMSQIRLGVVVFAEDSMITHMDFGFAQISNIRSDYPLPFELEPIIKSMTDTLFIDKNVNVELVEIDKRHWEEYKNAKSNMQSGKFKKFRDEWFKEIINEYQVNAFVVFYTAKLNINVGMHGDIYVETLPLCFSNLGGKSRSTIYINLKGNAFWKSKPKVFHSPLIKKFYLTDDFKILPDGEAYTSDYLLKLKKPYMVFIEKQLREMRRTESYKLMYTEFRRLIAIEKHKKQLETLKK